MLVTPEMTTEGGESLSRLADLICVDDVGVQVTEDGEHVILVADSTAYPNVKARMDADDAERLAELLAMRARELRGGGVLAPAGRHRGAAE
jgi:hypothetical protein